MGYYDIRQIPPFLAANGKRPVHLTYPFASHHYDRKKEKNDKTFDKKYGKMYDKMNDKKYDKTHDKTYDKMNDKK